jgi:hypothetical protein
MTTQQLCKMIAWLLEKTAFLSKKRKRQRYETAARVPKHRKYRPPKNEIQRKIRKIIIVA